MKKSYLPISLALMLGACTSSGPVLESRASGPTAVLLAQAGDHELAGDINKSIALVERAVRIEPRNAFAWHRLAKLYFSLNKYGKAEQFARRSLQFAAGNKNLIQENQQLIELIRARHRQSG